MLLCKIYIQTCISIFLYTHCKYVENEFSILFYTLQIFFIVSTFIIYNLISNTLPKHYNIKISRKVSIISFYRIIKYNYTRARSL